MRSIEDNISLEQLFPNGWPRYHQLLNRNGSTNYGVFVPQLISDLYETVQAAYEGRV